MGDLLKGGFSSAFSTFFNIASAAAPRTQDSATQALAVRRFYQSTKSHPRLVWSHHKKGGGGGAKLVWDGQSC